MAYDPYWKKWKPDPREKSSSGKIISPGFRCYPEFDGRSLDVVFFYLLKVWNATVTDALDELTLLLRFADVTPALPHDWRLIDHHGSVAVLAPDGTIRLGSSIWAHARKDVRYKRMTMMGRANPVIMMGPGYLTEYYDKDGKLTGWKGDADALSQEAKRQLQTPESQPKSEDAPADTRAGYRIIRAELRRMHPGKSGDEIKAKETKRLGRRATHKDIAATIDERVWAKAGNPNREKMVARALKGIR